MRRQTSRRARPMRLVTTQTIGDGLAFLTYEFLGRNT
jgi:hypothetical protein